MSEQSMNELPAVARNISLDCKNCGVERYHVVVAHTTATSAKVKCEVCGATKTYKLPKAQKKKATGTKARTPRKPAVDNGAVWSELKDKIGTDRVQPYSMKGKFTIAAAIEHPKFGVGFVTLATNEKIDVHFQEGSRSLVHNRP